MDDKDKSFTLVSNTRESHNTFHCYINYLIIVAISVLYYRTPFMHGPPVKLPTHI